MAIISVSAFVAVVCLVLLVYSLVGNGRQRLDSRLEDLSDKGMVGADPNKEAMAQMARAMLPRIAKPLIPENKEERTRLEARLIHAGLYSPHALQVFLGVKMLLMFGPVCVGVLAGLAGLPFYLCLFAGVALGVLAGSLGPSFWLDKRKAARQGSFRRSLPDALDVLVICLEGGLSLTAAFRRVGAELRTAHPLLASELNILQREMQLGQSAGEALRHFGDRADLEELRGLASVIVQSDRLGASLGHALRVHADGLRFKRMQYAEEMAQKAAIKMMFPTLLLIFPGIFVVVLGPAAIRIMDLMANLGPK